MTLRTPRFSLAIAMTAAIFTADVLIPLGYAVWLLYFLPLIIAASRQRPARLPPLPFIASLLIIAGFFLFPSSEVAPRIALANRSMAIAVIWATSFIIIKRKQAQEALDQSYRDLERGVEERTRQLSEANAYLTAEIAERQRAEEELRESEGKFRDLTERSMVGVYLLCNGVFCYINPRFAEIFGYTVEELLNKSYVDLVLPDDLPWMEECVRKRLEGIEQYGHYTFRGIRKNGTGLYLEVHNTRTVYQGSPAIIGGLADITARKQAEEALRETGAKYRSLFENAVDGIYLATPTGQFIDANPAMARMLGYASPQELVANVTDIQQQLYVEPELRSQLIKSLDEHDVVERFETRLYRKDGSVIWLSLSARAIRDSTGHVLHFEGTAEDITERKRAEEALRLSEARYRTLHRDIPTMIFTLDREGIVLSVNPFGASQLGYTVEELEGQPVLNVFHEGDHAAVADQLGKCLQNPSQVYRWQFRKIRKDGALLWVEELAQAVLDLNGMPNVLVVCQDITERKRAEALLSGQNRVLEMIAMNEPLEDVLESMVRLMESQSEEMLGSVLLLDDDKVHVRHGAAPNLPDAYNKAIDGVSIGPQAGSCGTAMYRGEPVIVTDILQDPLWTDYRDLAERHGLRACWSTPILSRQNEVLGSFAMYYREPRSPSPADQQLIHSAIFTAGIAIEHKRADEALRKAHDELEQKVAERTKELSEANLKAQGVGPAEVDVHRLHEP